MSTLDKYAKALVAAALAVLAALLPAVGDGHITATEIVIMVTAGLTTLATVWGVPNARTLISGGGYVTGVDAAPAPTPPYDAQHD